ncbi:hypothetical protein H0H87_001881 [Tephrocybe sp. NHM501043]|nr:hypothetical protein H0H87_001881 [Tephrocybe sp. NHM501043]
MAMSLFGSNLDATIDILQNPLMDPSLIEEGKERIGSLVARSLLQNTNTFMYLGHEFEYCRIPVFEQVQVDLGDELPAGLPDIAHLLIADGRIVKPELHTDNRYSYPDIPMLTPVMCATHAFGVKAKDSPEMWTDIITYLQDSKIPATCDTPQSKANFLHSTKHFFLHDQQLWHIQGNGASGHRP